MEFTAVCQVSNFVTCIKFSPLAATSCKELKDFSTAQTSPCIEGTVTIKYAQQDQKGRKTKKARRETGKREI
jgi:hypothetical protein